MNKIGQSKKKSTTASDLNVVPIFLDQPSRSDLEFLSNKLSVAIHLHLFYEDMIDDCISYLLNVPFGFNLYISVKESSDTENVKKIFQGRLNKADSVIVEKVPNRGRDLASLIIQFGKRLLEHDIIGHIHTKKSPHNIALQNWFSLIMQRLYGSESDIIQIFELLNADGKIVFPEGNIDVSSYNASWSGTYNIAEEFLKKHSKLDIRNFPIIDFPQGSMFWAKTRCLKEFLSLPIKYADFPEEPIPTDGTLVHAIERLILIFASTHNGICYRIHKEDYANDYKKKDQEATNLTKEQKMIKNDKQLKMSLPFDLYGRYAIIRDVINTNRKASEKFKVLDVGGQFNLMKKFLPEDAVFYLDPNVDLQDDNFIKGDGCAMPLEDESFDWVVSADVFEHIPKEKRNDFLKENIRVAKSGMILVAPFDSAEVQQAEINANDNYKILSGGEDHIWLKEHIANGLPKEKELENFVKEKGLEFQKLHNNRIFIWEILQGIGFFAGNNLNENIKKGLEDFNYFYNSEVFPHDSAEPSYRKIYFIKKDMKLNNIEVKNKPIDDLLFLNTIKRAMDLIGEVDIENKKIFQQKDQAIQQKDQAIQQKDSELQQKDQAIQQKDSEIREREKIISQKENKLQQKENEIAMMKSSKFWKIRNKYINLKNKLRIK